MKTRSFFLLLIWVAITLIMTITIIGIVALIFLEKDWFEIPKKIQKNEI